VEQQYILTLEELSFSLAYCGYEDMAAGMLKENLGEISEESWELVFQTAARSLLSKGILLNLNEEDTAHSFVDGFKDLLDDMANSTYMLRGYNETENGQFVLTVHQGKHGLVYHLVSNQIIHVLNYIKRDELFKEMTEFFRPMLSDERNLSLSCTEEDFHLLNNNLQNNGDLHSFIRSDHPLGEHQHILESYVNDYRRQEGNLVNVSLIKTEENQLPAFVEVYLLLISDERTWVIRNTNPDKSQEPQLTIQTINAANWQELLNDLISSVRGGI
jgi:hypothetical protein